MSSNQVADRIRFLSRAMGVVFLVGWGAWFWPFDDLLDRQGTPLGADFSMFYVAGQVVADGAIDQLYNQAEHQRRLHELFPGLRPQFCLPFRYPPVVALMAAPLARLPYTAAWVVFTFASSAAFGLALWLLSRPAIDGTSSPLNKTPSQTQQHGGSETRPGRVGQKPECDDAVTATPEFDKPGWRSTAIWACLGWPVALEVLIGGQASHFGLLIAVASCVLLQKGRYVAAGAVLALSAYKPNVLALFAIGVAVRHPRVMFGAIPVVGALVGWSCYAGQTPLVEFATLTTQLASGPWDVESPYWKVHSLATWFEFVAPGHGRLLTLLVGFAAALAVGSWWRLKEAGTIAARPIALALLLVINALFNPYTPIYDLVLLAGAAWFAQEAFAPRRGCESTISARNSQWLLATLYFGPHLSQGLARSLGVQLFPMILVAISIWVIVGLLAARKPYAGLISGGWIVTRATDYDPIQQ